MASREKSKLLENLAFEYVKRYLPEVPEDLDIANFFKRIEDIKKGHIPETEFLAMLAWLGNCAAIHRIDDTPMPIESESREFRAPDFLVFAKYNNRVIPVLIEAKSNFDEKHVWTETYLNSLQNFARLLNLPLLLAWKWYGLWMVVDVGHFQRKVTSYHLDYETALKENLLGVLFNDAFIKINDEACFRFDAEIVNTDLDPSEELIDEGTYEFKVESAGFYVGDDLIKDISSECSFILFSSFNQNKVTRLGGNRVRTTFYHDEETSFHGLYEFRLAELFIQAGAEEEIDWNQVVRQGSLQSSADNLRRAIYAPGTSQFIDLVLHQVPQTMPDFLLGTDT
jgi:hypothetical protein